MKDSAQRCSGKTLLDPNSMSQRFIFCIRAFFILSVLHFFLFFESCFLFRWNFKICFFPEQMFHFLFKENFFLSAFLTSFYYFCSIVQNVYCTSWYLKIVSGYQKLLKLIVSINCIDTNVDTEIPIFLFSLNGHC